MLVFRSAVAAEEKLIASSPYERYYIAGTRTMTYRELMSLVTKAMYRRGLISSDELAEAAFEDIDQFAVYASYLCSSLSGIFTKRVQVFGGKFSNAFKACARFAWLDTDREVFRRVRRQ